MVVKILIFNLFFILISLSTLSSDKTIFGKAKVIDGDTIHINKNKIRLHGIDAPETNQTCNKNSKVWNCGVESTKFLKELIGNNKIECITKGKDRYNRFIGICYKDNLDLNSVLFIGDTKADLQAAQKNSINFIGIGKNLFKHLKKENLIVDFLELEKMLH